MSDANDVSEALNLLIAMGFAAGEARDALARHGGNVERAANALLMEEEDVPPLTNATNVIQIEGSISQYSTAEHGRSACTCIALQGARQFLAAMRVHHDRIAIDAAFLDDMVRDGCRIYAEGHWNASSEQNAMEHTSVEDVIHLFPDLAMGPVRQGLLTDDGVALIQAAAAPTNDDDWVCLILIKPPETVLVCLPASTNRTTSDGPGQYYLLDSHPRRAEFGTAHASARIHASLHDLWSASLARIFPAVRDLGPDVPAYLTALYNSWDVIPVRAVRRE